MKTLAILLAAATAQAQPLYIGTAAEAIYLADFNPKTGTLTKPELAAQYPKPGFLASHPSQPVIYSVGGDNTLAAFRIDTSFGLQQLDTIAIKGTGPCHLAVDRSGKTLVTANYGDGSIDTVRLEPDGKFSEKSFYQKLQGSGPNKNRQSQARTHGVYFNYANRHLFAPDLGADKVFIYKFHPETSEFTPNTSPSYSSPSGSGPRHMDLDPDEKHAYILNELSNTISVTTYGHEKGTLTEIQEITTLPADYKGKNTTAEIQVHYNGKFVYASNRGHNSIAAYQRDPDSGKLTHLQHAPCGGDIPRHFTLDPTGQWLLCAHQKSNTISVLKIDQETGHLGKPKSTVPAPSPICLLFP